MGVDLDMPKEVAHMRDYVRAEHAHVENAHSITDADAFSAYGVENGYSADSFRKKMAIKITKLSADHLEFDLSGVDPQFANALRRILLAEVPTMAIENVHIHNNTSIIQDEVLAHRLGLLPILADADDFEFVEGNPSSNSMLKFAFKVQCSKKADGPSTGSPEELYNNSSVYSNSLVWEPMAGQEEKFGEDGIKMVYDDILVAKMRPGQVIDVTCLATKGVGKEHAKWSPVSTAFYRLLPQPTLNEEIKGAAAEALVKKCALGVFDIEDGAAVVKNPRNCSMCRECIREPEMRPKISLLRRRDHFLFSIESTGVLSPEEILRRALRVLRAKATQTAANCESILNPQMEVESEAEDTADTAAEEEAALATASEE